MLQFHLKFTSPRRVSKIPAEGLQKVSQGAANRLLLTFKEHFKKNGGRRFWADAARSLLVVPQGNAGAQVHITHKGVSLQLHGGTVTPSGRISKVTGKPIKRLLVPVSDSPLKKRNRALAEMGYAPEEIKVIPSKNGGPPRLVWQRAGKRKTKEVTLGVLLPRVTIKPHPNVFPQERTMQDALTEGARDALKENKL